MFNSKSKIKNHFSGLKSPYASESINWFWKFIRDREKKLFCEIVQDLNKQICLDLGAGSCEYSKILLSMGAKKSVCVDFSSSLMSENSDTKIEKFISDVETFKTSERYDLILCLGILEFLDEPESFLIQVRDFLKPTGKIIVLLPLSWIWSFNYRFFYLLKGIIIRPLTLKKMNHFLTQKGFLLETMTTHGFFSGFSVYSLPETK